MMVGTTAGMGQTSSTVIEVRLVLSKLNCKNASRHEEPDLCNKERLYLSSLILLSFFLSLGSDISCTDLTYRCKNNKCISKVNPECDGTQDCDDGSDEENCGMLQARSQWAHVLYV